MEVREWQMGLEYVVVSNRTKFTLRVWWYGCLAKNGVGEQKV